MPADHPAPRLPDVNAAPLSLRRIRCGDVGVLSVAGEVDLAGEPELRGALAAALSGPMRGIVLDLGHCTFLDVRGLAVLLDAADRAPGRPARLVLAGTSPLLRRMLAVLHVDGELPLHTTVAEGIAALDGTAV